MQKKEQTHWDKISFNSGQYGGWDYLNSLCSDWQKDSQYLYKIFSRSEGGSIQSCFDGNRLYAINSSLSGTFRISIKLYSWTKWEIKRKFNLPDYKEKSKLILITEFYKRIVKKWRLESKCISNLWNSITFLRMRLFVIKSSQHLLNGYNTTGNVNDFEEKCKCIPSMVSPATDFWETFRKKIKLVDIQLIFEPFSSPKLNHHLDLIFRSLL